MKFTVKLPTNSLEVNQANQLKAEVEAFNKTEINKPLAKQKLKDIPTVPKLEFIEQPLLVDAKDITLAHINQDGEIQFKYFGEVYKANFDETVWNELETRFNN